MSDNANVVTVRLPASLFEAVTSEVNATGEKKAAIVIRRLLAAYGLSEDTPAPPAPSEIDKLRAEMQATIANLQEDIEDLKKPVATAA